MAGTNIVAVRSALVTALRALPGLAGVKVDYSYVAAHAEANREYVFGASAAEGSMTLGTMRGGVRHSREETLGWSLAARVHRPGERDTQAGDERVVAIGSVIEDYLAANPQLGGLASLLTVLVTGLSLDSWVDESGSHSELTYPLSIASYLE